LLQKNAARPLREFWMLESCFKIQPASGFIAVYVTNNLEARKVRVSSNFAVHGTLHATSKTSNTFTLKYVEVWIEFLCTVGHY
jgi:hypothetical protein